MARRHRQIPGNEGYLVEFKTFSGGLSVREMATTLCAFANTEGGTIYLGVTDSGEARGIALTPTHLDQVQNAAREGCSPPVAIELAQHTTTGGRVVLAVSTAKSDQLHSTAAGHSYVRVGTQDKRVLGDELLRLAETKSQVSGEDRLLDAGSEVIDQAALDSYYQSRRAVTSMGASLGAEAVLRKLGLAEQRGRHVRIRAGAFILFGKEDEELLLQREFTFVRYGSDTSLYAYREDVRLPAERMIQRLLELIRPHNSQGPRIQGLRRTERLLYPEEALREVLLNALAHRDYRMAGLRNDVRLYPDHLEVRSAGGLPSFITLETMAARHYSRNPKIMHALLILGLVEELGQGIALMQRALARNGNPPPEFRATVDQVTVIFRAPQNRILPEERESILNEYFRAHEHISRRQIEGALGIGSTMAKKVIADWLAKGYLRRVGTARNTRYLRK